MLRRLFESGVWNTVIRYYERILTIRGTIVWRDLVRHWWNCTVHSLRVFSRTILFPPTRYIEHMNGNFISLTRPNVRVAPEKVSIDYQYRSYSFPQRLQRLIKAVVVEPVKRKTSEFIWFKLTSNSDFNGENFFSLSEAFPCGLFRSTTKNWHRYC